MKMTLDTAPEGGLRRTVSRCPCRRVSMGTRLVAGAVGAILSWALAWAWAVPAWAAQPFPGRPVRLIVPFPAGGPTDILGRLVAARLAQSWGQQVVIDNRGGGGGTIGATLAARSPPDGHTLYLGGITTLAIAPSVHAGLAYDPVKDFSPVTLATVQPILLMVHPALPVHRVADMVALARRRPGQIHYASSGPGGSGHLAGELFKAVTATDLNHVPYKGAAAALNDLVGGQVQVMFGTMLAAVPHVKSGKLRAIAVTGERRSTAIADVPTFRESGLPGYDAVSWNGFVVPSGTPSGIVERINGDIGRILRAPNVLDRLEGDGVTPASGSPQAFAEFLRAELARWAKVVRDAKVRIE
jgi:tripartite-type tricarboxylate transporter receptor subunit TctC